MENLIAKLRAELAKAVVATYAAPTPKKPGRSRPELNYRALAKLFPEVVSGEYRYLRLEAGDSMMPLHLEWTGADEITISHTYIHNGDVMRDPEMTFRVDRDKGTLEPLTFQQDGSIQVYQQVYPEPGRWIPKLRSDLNHFAQGWFSNIAQQKYRKREAVLVRDGEDTRVTFLENGTAINPPPPKAADTGMAPAQEQAEAASPARTLDPVVFYRSLLEMVDREISRGWLYDYLRDHSIDYDTARDTLVKELPAYFNFIATGDPDMQSAYHTLPRFQEWLIEDLMERNYQDVSLDQRDAPDRYSKDADVPAWAKGALPTPKPQYAIWSAKGPIKRPEPVQDISAIDHSEQPESTAKVWRSPGGHKYHVGDTAEIIAVDGTPGLITLSEINENYIFYIFPDLEQEPVEMFRRGLRDIWMMAVLPLYMK